MAAGSYISKRKRKDVEKQLVNEISSHVDELNQDVLEQVLARLPISNFFRLTSVCRRWRSAATSATFKRACSQIPSREPWFFMVDQHDPRFKKNQPVVFDSAENNWKRLNMLMFPAVFQDKELVPVASSGGLVCFASSNSDLVVCNPLTGGYREVVSSISKSMQRIDLQLQAIGMVSNRDSYNIVLVHGGLSEFSFSVYSSTNRQWEEEAVPLHRKIDFMEEDDNDDDDNENAVYFLSKSGNVVSTDLQRSPCKQYSSVLIPRNGEKFMYFFSKSGRIVACNLTTKTYFEYPRLLPLYYEYSIDLVECGGEVYVVLLVEFLESASLRVWRFDEIGMSWEQIAVMPPAMSHEFYGKKVDINCSGAKNLNILVCINSDEVFSYFMCNLVGNEWIEVPKCHLDGEVQEFSCALSIEPRIEASV